MVNIIATILGIGLLGVCVAVAYRKGQHQGEMVGYSDGFMAGYAQAESERVITPKQPAEPCWLQRGRLN